jgi:hypothetical protein
MASITRFITTKLKLKVNEQKSAVAEPWERKFLGFSFTRFGPPKRRIAPKAVSRFKERVRGEFSVSLRRPYFCQKYPFQPGIGRPGMTVNPACPMPTPSGNSSLLAGHNSVPDLLQSPASARAVVAEVGRRTNT